MKTNSVAVAVLSAALFLGIFPEGLLAQESVAQLDLKARKNMLLTESSDLEGMAKSLNGTESSVALSIDEKIGQGVMEIDAVYWFVGIYESMQNDQDREVAKAVLKNRLAFYSYLLGLGADQTAGQLAFTKLPAIAQAGAQARDNLRAAKNKLDEIAASLN